MKFKSLIFLNIFLLLLGCSQYSDNQSNEFKKVFDRKYKNSGFSLIYNDQLKIKKIDQRSLTLFHKSLENKSFVKITNPSNGKSLIAEVKSNRVKFSSFYNSIITERIANDLELDLNEPYINITLISKNSTFVARKAKTFDEEKEVAEKAPIDGIQISNLDPTVKNKKKLDKNYEFSYSIKIADFYYKDTAFIMKDRIKNVTSIKKLKISRLSKTKYRVLIGPFNDIKSLKNSFEKLSSFNFENLEILKNE